MMDISKIKLPEIAQVSDLTQIELFFKWKKLIDCQIYTAKADYNTPYYLPCNALKVMFVLFICISLSLYVLECPIGYYFKNCSKKCSVPNYGEGCQSVCQCPDNDCHFANGCSQHVTSYNGYQPQGILI